jgi:hypothetical protein
MNTLSIKQQNIVGTTFHETDIVGHCGHILGQFNTSDLHRHKHTLKLSGDSKFSYIP